MKFQLYVIQNETGTVVGTIPIWNDTPGRRLKGTITVLNEYGASLETLIMDFEKKHNTQDKRVLNFEPRDNRALNALSPYVWELAFFAGNVGMSYQLLANFLELLESNHFILEAAFDQFL